MKIRNCILCEKVIVDENTSEASAIAITEDIGFPPPPEGISKDEFPIPLRLPFNVMWLVSGGRSDDDVPEPINVLDFKILSPDHKKLYHRKVTVNDLEKNDRFRIALVLPVFPFYGEGEYQFQVSCRGTRSKKSADLGVFVHDNSVHSWEKLTLAKRG